jgi:signal transduction histidine kinase
MEVAFSFVARRRWVAVGLACVVEIAVLTGLSFAAPEDVVGLPAAVVVAIAGTVAVVFGPLDGALVALVGAAVFGFSVGEWDAGEVAGLAVWPALVVAAGAFARRVEKQRRVAFRSVLAADEQERQRIARGLHDGTAQTLAVALMALRRSEEAASSDAAAASAEARSLVHEALESVRGASVDLRPRAIDDFGLIEALEQFALTVSEQAGIRVELDARDWPGRLPIETELVLYRLVQEAVAHATVPGADTIRITLGRDPATATVVIDQNSLQGGDRALPTDFPALDALRSRLRLLGGRLEAVSGAAGGVRLRVDFDLLAP